MQGAIVDEWRSNSDIIECIIASALIPFALNGCPFYKYRDWWCIDGGICNITGIRKDAYIKDSDSNLRSGFDVGETNVDMDIVAPECSGHHNDCQLIRRDVKESGLANESCPHAVIQGIVNNKSVVDEIIRSLWELIGISEQRYNVM